MDDQQTFKERVPIIGKMIEKAFNGDTPEGDSDVSFILIATRREGTKRETATLANFRDPGAIISLLLQAFKDGAAKFRTVDEGPVGHA